MLQKSDNGLRKRWGLKTDTAAGVILAAIGVIWLIAVRDLPFGTLGRMGPAYWPVIIAVLLIGMGGLLIVIDVAATHRSGGSDRIALPGLRPVLSIFGAIVVFALSIERLGMVPAIILCMLLAGYASAKVKWRVHLILTMILALFSYLVFLKLLGLPVRPFPWTP